MVYSNNFNQVRVGVRNGVVTQVVNAVDADATAFIAAAGITNLTQAAAISTLVDDLKTYGLWTKMKALYPFVGGSAASHKFNLKDPRDLDAAYRLVFNGGWTHSSTGALPNGTNGYADTKLIPSFTLSTASAHFSKYNRTNDSIGSKTDGTAHNTFSSFFQHNYTSANMVIGVLASVVSYTPTDTRGFFISTRTSNVVVKAFRNNSQLGSTNTNFSDALPNQDFYIGARNSGVPSDYNNYESAFASIGDGLTDTDASNFYTAVQKFNSTLGRQIGTPVVSDSDATSFISAAGITNNEQANAVNTLVTDLKTAGIWTKMKAIYPFVGGTATSHKFNLKDPRDVDAAFRLVFSGGWTHTSTGATPNGTTGYANTYLNPYVVFGNGQTHLVAGSTHSLVHVSKYSRTNSIPLYGYDGVSLGSGSQARGMLLAWSSAWDISNGYASLNGWALDNPRSSVTLGNRTDGFFVINRDSFTSLKSFRNNTLISTNTTDIRFYNEIGLQLNLNPNGVFLIGSLNDAYDGVFRPNLYNSFETSFQTIGWSLTDSENTAFYTAVQKFQTSLGRQIGTPVLPDGQIAKLLDSYTGAAAAYSLRKLRTAYTGYAIRVRRSSDNTSQDIGFDANGNLDTTSMLSFVGAGNGFVSIWYDQSGNGNNAAQTTAGYQPQIVSAGAVLLINSKPSIKLDGVDDEFVLNSSINSNVSTYQSFVGKRASSGDRLYALSNNAGNGYIFGLWNTNNYVLQGKTNFYQISSSTDTTTSQLLLTGKVSSGIMSMFKNGNIIPSTQSAATISPFINSIGKYLSSLYPTKCSLQEIVFYNNDQTSNQTGIESNINSFYTIY